MKRNLATSLKQRPRTRPMDRYDRLPPELRQWLAHAALPWSPHSVLKLWNRLCRECGSDPVSIRRRLDQAEQRMLAKDAVKVWGANYPGARLIGTRPSA